MAAIILMHSKDGRHAHIVQDHLGQNRVFITVQAATDWQDKNDNQMSSYSRILDLDD